MTGDPFWADVQLLTTFDTNYADLSSSNRTPSTTGSPSINATQYEFGGGSLDVSASASSSVSYGSSLALGSGQFTIECWARAGGTWPGGSSSYALVAQWNSAYNWFFGFDNNSGNGLVFYTNGSYSWHVGVHPTDNSWHHYCVDRDATNTLRLYIDGVVNLSVSAASTVPTGDTLYVGNQGGGSANAFPGQIDEVRVTVGMARYGGAFTVPTSAFPIGAASVTAHRYWRLSGMNTSPGGGASLAEVALCTSVGGTTVTGSGTASASTIYSSSYPASNAFDGNLSDLWSAASTDTSAWLQYDFGSGNAFAIISVKLTARNDGYPQYSPTSFSLQYSDDDSTWTTIGSFSCASWSNGSVQTFSVATPALELPAPPPFHARLPALIATVDPDEDVQHPMDLFRRRTAATIQPQSTSATNVAQTLMEVIASDPAPPVQVAQLLIEAIVLVLQPPAPVPSNALRLRLLWQEFDAQDEPLRPYAYGRRFMLAPPPAPPKTLVNYAVSVVT